MYIENPVNQMLMDRGMSQGELGNALGVAPGYLNRIINRKRTSGPVEYKVAKFFKKEIHELFPDRKKRGPRTSA